MLHFKQVFFHLFVYPPEILSVLSVTGGFSREGMLWGTHQVLLFSQEWEVMALQPDLVFSHCSSNKLFLWTLHLFFGIVYIHQSLQLKGEQSKRRKTLKTIPCLLWCLCRDGNNKRAFYKSEMILACLLNRVLIVYFLLINIIVVISFSVSKLLNCREFKQLVSVRDSGEP